MKLMKGKVMITPILKEKKAVLAIKQEVVTRAKVIQTGETEELTVGDTVYIKPTIIKKFTLDGRAMIMDEHEILAKE